MIDGEISMKRLAALLMLSVLITGLYVAPALAGAWPQAEGTGQLITTLATSTSDTGFDGRDNGRNLEFKKWELSPLFSWGVSEDASLFLKPTVQRLSADRSGGGTDHTSGLTDTELGTTFALWRGTASVFSLQPMVRLPFFYDPDDNPALGSGHVDLEMRALYGANLALAGIPSFLDAQLAWRQRTGAPADEASLDLTLGLRPDGDWMVLLQSFNTISVGDAGPGYGSFRRYKAQFSAVRRLTGSLSLQAGVNQAVGGRNDGNETGFLLALWLDI
jgi:hypothetical protein